MENVTTQQAIQSDEPVSMTELTAFAGKGHYPKDWEKYHEHKSFNAGFNGWAALWGIQWFFYRKLYVQGLISFCLEFCIPVGFILAARYFLGASAQYGRAVPYSAVFIYFFVKIAIGYWANIALYKKAVGSIKKINELNLDNERHLSVLSSLGQPSFQAVLFLYLGFAIFKVGLEILR
jgi:hypothetical protein